MKATTPPKFPTYGQLRAEAAKTQAQCNVTPKFTSIEEVRAEAAKIMATCNVSRGVALVKLKQQFPEVRELFEQQHRGRVL